MSWLVANTFAAALLALVALAVGRWGRPSPAVMHGLWLLVLLKLVTPPLFAVPVSLDWLRAGHATAERAPAAPVSDVVLPTFAPDAVVTAHVLSDAPPAASPAAPTVPVGYHAAPLAPPPSAGSALADSPWLVAWLASAALLLATVCVAALRALRRQRRFAAVAAPLQAEVRALAAQLGVRPPPVHDDPAAPAPYVWTLGRARLIVPAAALLRCPPRGRAAVLAHELAHLYRRDHWVARAEPVLTALLWWHPLFWFARAHMRLWAELACDAIAVRAVPGANLDYATLLVDAAARPSTTGPATVVLASRPAARAAFERRLNMILTDAPPARASRAWILPFAGLTLGLFAMPVAATAQEPEPEPVRIEIRVNGERVEGLSAEQRAALLEVLQAKQPRAEAKAKAKAKRVADAERSGFGADVKGALAEALREARDEIANDPDLQELGITDEVTRLIDDVASGKGIESSIDGVVRAAMKGAGKMALREIESDPDLQRMGLTKGIGALVSGFLGDPRNQELVGDLAKQAIDAAIGEARRELRGDADLQRLGIAGDVERLLDAVVSGGSVDVEIGGLIEKALEAAGAEAKAEQGAERAGRERGGDARAEAMRQIERARAELERAEAELRRLERRQRGGIR